MHKADFSLYSKTYFLPSFCTGKKHLHEWCALLYLAPHLASANAGSCESWPSCAPGATVQVPWVPAQGSRSFSGEASPTMHCTVLLDHSLPAAELLRSSPGPTLDISASRWHPVALGTIACRTQLHQSNHNLFSSDVFLSPGSGTDVTRPISTAWQTDIIKTRELPHVDTLLKGKGW